MREITKIILHCSDSEFGDQAMIGEWHKARGWNGCGYHFVITNGVIRAGQGYDRQMDGVLQRGRLLDEVGAHCRGQNADSIGICLVGRRHFTGEQLLRTLPDLCRILLAVYRIPPDRIFGHSDFSEKSCPNFDVGLIRRLAL